MTDANKRMYPQPLHLGSHPADIRIRIRINSEIRIRIPDHFCLRFWPWCWFTLSEHSPVDLWSTDLVRPPKSRIDVLSTALFVGLFTAIPMSLMMSLFMSFSLLHLLSLTLCLTRIHLVKTRTSHFHVNICKLQKRFVHLIEVTKCTKIVWHILNMHERRNSVFFIYHIWYSEEP